MISWRFVNKNNQNMRRRKTNMIKSLYIRRSLMMLITSLLVVSQLNLTVFQAFAEEKGEEPLSYEVQEELSKDKKKAKLKIKATSNNNQVEILS
ncbi:TPA: hypothetical protein U0V90_002947, partial [Listeria monocytogenes]|nr:hypothetical protein [Listeria monocytogenes]